MDTVDADSRDRVIETLATAIESKDPIWREVNHQLDDGTELPIRYCCIYSKELNVLIALGRDLRQISILQQQLLNAQQTLEQDYWKLRQVETRYRLIFDMAVDAVLVVDEPSNIILEANPVANKLLLQNSKTIIGKSFPIGFDKSSMNSVSSLLAETRVTGKSSASKIHLLDNEREYKISINLIRQDNESRFLIRLYHAHTNTTQTHEPTARLSEVIESAPDAIVITDMQGLVQYANPSFIKLSQVASIEQAVNQSMERWLGRTGVDLNILITNLQNYGAVKLYASKLRGELGAVSNVEISAAVIDEVEPELFIIFIRDIERRVSSDATTVTKLPRSIEQITQQVGKLPLKEIVRESSDLIEKTCIEAALELTDDNRASAAEILGLSRQSLYAKLKTHEIADLSNIE